MMNSWVIREYLINCHYLSNVGLSLLESQIDVAMITIATFLFLKVYIVIEKKNIIGKRGKVMENIVEAISYEDDIIQLKLLNVPKHPKMIARIFRIIQEQDINIDMISQVMLEDSMQIEITLDAKFQLKLNEAIVNLKEEFTSIEIYQKRTFAKVAVGGPLIETTPGAAARCFEVLGNNNIHFYQITTSKRTISFVIDKDSLDLALEKLKLEFNL